MIDVVIVGAGLPSCVLAAALSRRQRPPSVLVVDDRPWVGGHEADQRCRETDVPLGATRYLDAASDEAIIAALARDVRMSPVGCAAKPGWERRVYPQGGWSAACRRLLDGADVVLGAAGVENLPRILAEAKTVYWTPRLDHLPHREWGGWELLGNRLVSRRGRPTSAAWLAYRDVQVTRCLLPDDQPPEAEGPRGRILNHRRIVGGDSRLGTVETPMAPLLVSVKNRWPSDPGIDDARTQLDMAKANYPNLQLMGRLAHYRPMSLGSELAEAMALGEAFGR